MKINKKKIKNYCQSVLVIFIILSLIIPRYSMQQIETTSYEVNGYLMPNKKIPEDVINRHGVLSKQEGNKTHIYLSFHSGSPMDTELLLVPIRLGSSLFLLLNLCQKTAQLCCGDEWHIFIV